MRIIGMLMRGAWDLWMTEWEKSKILESMDRLGSGEVRLVEVDVNYSGMSIWQEIGVGMMRMRSWMLAKWFLLSLRMRRRTRPHRARASHRENSGATRIGPFPEE